MSEVMLPGLMTDHQRYDMLRQARGSSLHRRGEGEPFEVWPDYNQSAAHPNEANPQCLDDLVLTRGDLDKLLEDSVARVRRFLHHLPCPNDKHLQSFVVCWGVEDTPAWSDDRLLHSVEVFQYLLQPAACRDNLSLLREVLQPKTLNTRKHDLGHAYQTLHLVSALLDRRIEPDAFKILPPLEREAVPHARWYPPRWGNQSRAVRQLGE